MTWLAWCVLMAFAFVTGFMVGWWAERDSR
jgi:hypothetical protein